MRLLKANSLAILALAALAACADDPTNSKPPEPTPTPKPAPTPVGVYELQVTGIGSDQQMQSTLLPVGPSLPQGVNATLTNAGVGIVFEQVSSSSFIEGTRAAGGERYVSFTYRVRNGTGSTLNNLTLMMVGRSNTYAGSPINSIKKFDGTDPPSPASIAQLIVPTGAVAMGGDLVSMQALYPDVLQVLTEAEAAAITLPGDVSAIFPYGYVVRSARSTTNRQLPATADANQFDGLLTVSFRVPLQPVATNDVFSISFQILAVTDSEVRLTETIEEGADSAAVRRLRERAVALGATTVTVLNGSSVTDAAVPDYPGQRQICGMRVAGSAASPTTLITSPAGYTQLYLMRPSESLNACAAYFRSGTPGRPATNVPFTLTLRAMDRYGNQKSVIDTVRVEEASGPPYAAGPPIALSGGQAPVDVLFSDYGTAVMTGIGRRIRGQQSILVAGVTRTWTAGAGTTDWHTNNNWSPAAVPMSLDSVVVPAAAPLDPALAANVTVEGVTVEDVALIALGAFNLTANANVTAGTTGGITNTSGTLFLAGTARTVQGKLPRLRVTGTYSLTGNVTARAPIQVDAGRLTASAFRLQADAN